MTSGEYIEQQYENSTLFTNVKEDTTMITLENDSINQYSKTLIDFKESTKELTNAITPDSKDN